jgi:hypothetical protein
MDGNMLMDSIEIHAGTDLSTSESVGLHTKACSAALPSPRIECWLV